MRYGGSALARLLRDPMGAAGLVLVLMFLTMAAAAPVLTPYDPTALDTPIKHQSPSWAHWAGTDHLGRDLLARIILGARTVLAIAATWVGIAGALGLMEASGGFIFICFEPLVALHDANLIPVILADGHPDPAQVRRA